MLGAIILFDSGQMTWESFRSRGLDGDEVDDFESAVLLETFVGVFMLDEDVEDLSVDGFAGTRK